MPGRLSGKVAAVTAAGQGIGRAVAAAFVAEGATVHASDLHAAKLDGLAAASSRALDVRSGEAVAAFARDVGRVDVLVNAAGFVHHGTVLDTDDEAWDYSFDLNVTAMRRTIRAFLPAMLEGGGGSIVNIASIASTLKGIPNRFAYGASKAAVIGLTKSVAADFIRRGVRCNCICPGTVQSPSLDERIAAQARASGQTEAAVRQSFVDRQPMGRLGTAAEIAMLAVYLASDEAAFTTGQAMISDGGMMV